jgi:hypothetical protein
MNKETAFNTEITETQRARRQAEYVAVFHSYSP